MTVLPTAASGMLPTNSALVAPVFNIGIGRSDGGAVAGYRAPVRGFEPHDDQTVFKIASCREELYAAFTLVYKAYVRAGLSEPNPYQMRVTPHQLLPTTEIFVAVDRGQVICTMSLVGDGELGLPMEVIYDLELAWRRSQGIRLGEVSCLAQKREGSRSSLPVLMRLMSLMAQCARRREIDQLMIAVHPRHVKFYQRFAAFEPIGEEKTYQTVCNKPAVAMALDLVRAPMEHPHLYEKYFGVPFPDESLQQWPMPDELRSELGWVVDASYDTEDCYGLLPV